MKKLLLVLLIIGFSCEKEQLNVEEFQIESLEERVVEGLPPPSGFREDVTYIINEEPVDSKKQSGLAKLSTEFSGCGTCDETQLWDTLYYRGPNKVNVVFVAEGFKSTQMTEYNQLVESIIVGVFDGIYEDQFGYNDSPHYNFFTYRTPSVESGLSVRTHVYNDIGDNIVDTAWGIYRNKIGLSHYTGIPDDKRTDLNRELTHKSQGYLSGKKVYPIILVNDTRYAAGADFEGLNPKNSKISVAIATKNVYMLQLVAHEFLHSFGDLDDEYVEDAGDPTGNTALPINTAYAMKNYEPDVWSYPSRRNTSDFYDPNASPPSDIHDECLWCSTYIVLPNKGTRYVSSGKWRAMTYDDCCPSDNVSIMENILSPMRRLNHVFLHDRVMEEIN